MVQADEGSQTSLEDLLTIVIVTSPIPSHPSTEMLEWTLGSYVAHGSLAKCAKLIVSDGYTVAAEGQKDRPKSGRVPSEWVSPYEEFRDRLDAIIATCNTGDEQSCEGSQELGNSGGLFCASCTLEHFSHCRHLRMERHKGFGGCTYCALRLVTTAYVLVLQHDRPCLRTFRAAQLLAAMEASQGRVKYLGLPTKSSLSRTEAVAVRDRCRLRLEPTDLEETVAAAARAAGIDLRLLLFWYDSSHLCEVSHYRDFVFARGRVPAGGFPEDSFGQVMHAEICAAVQDGNWREVHTTYGTYLFVDGAGSMVGHTRGRRFIEKAKLDEKGWNGPQRLARACSCCIRAQEGDGPLCNRVEPDGLIRERNEPCKTSVCADVAPNLNT